MKMLAIFTVISNIFVISVLLFGLFYKFQNPKNKAKYGFWLAGSILLAMLTLGLYMILGILTYHKIYLLSLILCIVSPFIIGRFVKFETLKFYTVLQILCFGVGLFIICL